MRKINLPFTKSSLVCLFVKWLGQTQLGGFLIPEKGQINKYVNGLRAVRQRCVTLLIAVKCV